MALDNIGSILDVITGMGQGDVGAAGVGSSLPWADPYLMSLMADLGYSNSLAGIGTAETLVPYLLQAGVTYDQMQEQFGREADLTAANVAQRGLSTSRGARDDRDTRGLVSGIGYELGKDQGYRQGQFLYDTESTARNSLLGLAGQLAQGDAEVARTIGSGAKLPPSATQ